MTSFEEDIKGTFVDEIREIPDEQIIEPRMKVGPEPKHVVKGAMTSFEKQCFTMLSILKKRQLNLLLNQLQVGLNHAAEHNKEMIRLALDEASRLSVARMKAILETQIALDKLSSELQEKELTEKLLAVKSLLRETVKSRLKLSRGANVRYYLSEGFKIVAETGISDISGEFQLSEEEFGKLFKINPNPNEEGVDNSGSVFTESLCVLF